MGEIKGPVLQTNKLLLDWKPHRCSCCIIYGFSQIWIWIYFLVCMFPGAGSRELLEIRLDNQCLLFPALNSTNNEEAPPFSCRLNNCHPISGTGDNGVVGKPGHCAQSITSLAISTRRGLSVCALVHTSRVFLCVCICACVVCLPF